MRLGMGMGMGTDVVSVAEVTGYSGLGRAGSTN